MNGEAKASMQDIAIYKESRETLALLKLLALAGKDVEVGKIRPVGEAFAAIRERVKIRIRRCRSAEFNNRDC